MHKLGVAPVIIHFNGVFQYEPSILGYPHDELETSMILTALGHLPIIFKNLVLFT